MSHETDGDRNTALWGIYWFIVALVLSVNWHGCSIASDLHKIANGTQLRPSPPPSQTEQEGKP